MFLNLKNKHGDFNKYYGECTIDIFRQVKIMIFVIKPLKLFNVYKFVQEFF